MEAKWTPGPWRIKNITGRTGRSTASIVGPDNRGSLATVRVRYLQEDNLAEFAANARLIAAAPNLLEALKDIEAYLSGSDCQAVRMADALHFAKVAIAKAGGEA